MNRTNRWHIVLATLLVLSFTLSACAPQPAATATPEPTKAPTIEPTTAPAAVEPTKPASTTGAGTPEENEKLVRTLDPKALPAGWTLPKTVGHVTNYLVHEWYQNETKGEKARAADYGIDFTINDANLDLQKSLAAVDDYLAKGTNALVFTPVNEKASAPTIQKAVKTMPVICEGSPTDGCLTLVSIDDYLAGEQVGIWAGNYAKANFGGKAVVLDVGLPALSTTVARSKGFVDGLKSVLPDATIAQSLDGKGLKDEAVKVAADALTAHPDVNIIFGINDDSALGGQQAFEAAGLDTTKLLVVGFGCEGKACKSALEQGGPYKVSAAMFPEYQGRLLIDAAIAVFNGAKLPAHIVAPTLAMTKDSLAKFYTKSGDSWAPNFEAIAALPLGQAALDMGAAPAPAATGAATPEENEKLVRTLDPKALPAGWTLPKTVGHVTNYLVHEWYQNETKGEKARAADYGIDFTINDANLDLQKSLAAVDDYLAKGTNALVFTPVNEKASAPTIQKAVKTMPVICEGSPTDGCLTLVSIDDYLAGEQVGIWAGNYAKANFGGKAVVLDVGLPALSTTVARSKGFVDGLKSVLPDATIAQSLDGKGLKDEAVKVAADALTAHPDVNIIFGINDDSALGGQQAFEAAGLDTTKLLVVGFGCEGKACKSALEQGGPYKVSAAMFPEYQGRLLIDAAIAVFNGAKLPAHIVAPTLAMTKDSLAKFYTKSGDSWAPNFEAIAALPLGQAALDMGAAPAATGATPEEGEKLVRTLDPKALPAGWKLPKTVGHVTNYLVHEWYQNETKGEKARAADYGIDFTINDANLDLQKSLAAVDDYLAKGTNALVFTPVNEKASAPTIQKAAKTMPVICEGSPTDGCLTLVSIDDYAAGQQVGVWAGNYAKANFGGKAVVLDVGLPALSTTVARSKGFIDGLKSVLPDAKIAQSLDGKGLKDEAVKVAADALTAHPDVNIIFGINDDSALGGQQAFEAAGLDTTKLLVVGFGCEGKACKSALEQGGPYKVSAAMFPEYQGRLLIDAAIAAFNGAKFPAHIVAPSTPITKDNLSQFYTKSGDTYAPNFDAMAKLPVK